MADVLDLTMRAMAYPVCWTILVNGLDDLFIDANYFLRGLFKEENRRITVEDLMAGEQKRLAMMVPAWQEAGVIQHMLELNLENLNYDQYDIFVGTYLNDPDTQARVDAVARRARNVHKVVVPHDGPTSKADCLNWVYQHIKVLEEQRGVRFDILLMHDAEDIIHPLALRLYNYLIPDHDFVQTPVFPLEMPWHAFVASTYKDEFAEHHLKDMLVREQIGGLVPSAGVGSGFDRDAFEDIALAHSQEAFNIHSLTEDYELGMKFRLANKKVYFACRAVERVKEVERGFFKKRKVHIVQPEYIATREFFPDELEFAIKQRSRWILGIGLQTWEQLGWRGSLPVLYCLWRDRKALITNFMAIFAYCVALYCVTRLGAGWLSGRPWTFDNIFPPGSVLWWLVMGNTLVLAWRAVMKYVTVDAVYGPMHGMLSIPRFFVSNVINFAATSKAVKQYINHKITGEPLKWLKTTHVFPDTAMLKEFKRRLGDLLREREGLTESELDQALDLQDKTGLKLGQVVSLTGLLSVRAVADAMGEQYALPVIDPDPFGIPLTLLQRLPESDAALMRVLPIGFDGEDVIRVAVSEPPSPEVLTKLEAILRGRVSLAFAAREVLSNARDRAYRRLVLEAADQPRDERIGERLIAGGYVTPERLERGLQEQVETGERIGELLVRRGWAPAGVVSELLSDRTRLPFRPLQADECDPAAVRKLGYGLLSLYGIVPLRNDDPATNTQVACASLPHEEVRMLVAARLGKSLEFFLAPSLDVRLALAVASKKAWPGGITAGIGGMDGSELKVIDDDPGWRGDLVELRDAAIDNGRSPIDYLLAAGRIEPQLAARLRARSLGVALAQPSTLDPDGAYDWLPPGWALRDDIQLVDLSRGSLVVAAPRPTPRLSRAIAALFPDAAIAWRVAPYSRAPETTSEESESRPGMARDSAPGVPS
ncbi:MAG: glycosyl transferase family protein [Proteobacteria bacterium]|nr:glycosyl transferase family protein [Pseudomonadota bacterium]